MKLIMFDYDGVIVDSFALLKRIYIKIVDVLGIELEARDEILRDLLELDYRETYRKLDITAKDKVKISDFLFRFHSSKYRSDVKLYDGIPDVLEELSKRYILAIVTNNFRKELSYRLKLYKIDKYFSAVFTSEDGELKPSPDLLIKCMKRLNAKPSESAFIGDMDGDIIAGKRAKVSKTIAVTYGYHLKHRLKDADLLIESPSELLKVFSE